MRQQHPIETYDNMTPSFVAKKYILLALLIAIPFLAFSGIVGNTFIIYDDPEYVTENAHVLAGLSWDGVKWAFTSYGNANWHPLTWLSHMLDVQIYGLDPAGHHLTSLLFHVLNTALLFIVLHDMSGCLWRSFAVAMLFGVHPLHVESVAWVAERKDVLSGFFFMLILWAYVRYARKPCMDRYLLVVAFFVMGLLAKPMLVTLPLLLLFLDYWPLGRMLPSPYQAEGVRPFRFPVVVWEKIPLFILAAVSSVITYVGQLRGGATPRAGAVNLAENLMNGIVSYCRYAGKLIWPHDLAVFYPRGPISVAQLVSASAFILGVTVAALLLRKRHPFVLVGWLWFVFALLPVIGLVRIGSSAMSDRYTYIPAIGFFILLSWSVAALLSRRLPATVQATAFVLLVSVLSLLTVRQVGYWKNSFTLFGHALEVTDGNWLAYNNLASSYIVRANNDPRLNLTRFLCSKEGCEYSDAIRKECLRRAIEASEAAVRTDPSYASAYFNLGLAHIGIGDRQSAQAVRDRLSRLDPVLSERLERNLHRRE